MDSGLLCFFIWSYIYVLVSTILNIYLCVWAMTGVCTASPNGKNVTKIIIMIHLHRLHVVFVTYVCTWIAFKYYIQYFQYTVCCNAAIAACNGHGPIPVYGIRDRSSHLWQCLRVALYEWLCRNVHGPAFESDDRCTFMWNYVWFFYANISRLTYFYLTRDIF